jgi:hypothetical protein
MRDAAGKGRMYRAIGEANLNTKLTVDQVKEIRRRSGSGESAAFLGRSLGVSKSCVAHVVQRRNWRWVSDDA